MSGIESPESHRRDVGAPRRRLAAAAKQLRIVRDELDDDAPERSHVEVAIREAEAAKHCLD